MFETAVDKSTGFRGWGQSPVGSVWIKMADFEGLGVSRYLLRGCGGFGRRQLCLAVADAVESQ